MYQTNSNLDKNSPKDPNHLHLISDLWQSRDMNMHLKLPKKTPQ